MPYKQLWRAKEQEQLTIVVVNQLVLKQQLIQTLIHQRLCLSIMIVLDLLHKVNVIENTLGQILEELELVVQVLIHLSLDQH